ncbi:11938_t:CDS:2 [Entrophospora sp. SA101]|nr:11938_t:CDS:2 [Entrophospora sp. SA101]
MLSQGSYIAVRDANDNIHEAIHKNSQKVFVNGKEANCDGFSFLSPSEYCTCFLIAFQIKYTELDSEHSKRINQELIDTKYKKASEVLKQKTPIKEWVFTILSNASRVNTLRVVDLPDRCAIVDQTNFQAFYRYTFANRAQFSAANAKIHINSARSYELKLIRGIGPTIAEKIEPVRKRKFSDTMDDLLERVPKFPRSERFIML